MRFWDVMIRRAVTAQTTLVIVSPKLVPQMRLGSFPPLFRTASPWRTKWSTTHSVVRTKNTIHTKASYEIENRPRFRRMAVALGFDEDCDWCSGISTDIDVEEVDAVFFLEDTRAFPEKSASSWLRKKYIRSLLVAGDTFYIESQTFMSVDSWQVLQMCMKICTY